MNDSLELLLDTILDSYKYDDVDAREDAKQQVIETAQEHIMCPSRSLNAYAVLAHELYAVYMQRRNPEMLNSAVLLYAIGMVRHNEFSKLTKKLPCDIDPSLPGIKKLSDNNAKKACIYFEREGRFDLAMRVWERRGDYELARAYRVVDTLKNEVQDNLTVH